MVSIHKFLVSPNNYIFFESSNLVNAKQEKKQGLLNLIKKHCHWLGEREIEKLEGIVCWHFTAISTTFGSVTSWMIFHKICLLFLHFPFMSLSPKYVGSGPSPIQWVVTVCLNPQITVTTEQFIRPSSDVMRPAEQLSVSCRRREETSIQNCGGQHWLYFHVI